jgi:hypothetical protein
MKLKFTILGIALLFTFTSQAQRKPRNTANDTISSNYIPANLFSPAFHTEKGTEFHSVNGDPGAKYWQNRVDYVLKAKIDTDNSPDALQYLWLQMDQNTYKKDARSNFVTGNQPKADQHTTGYQLESVSISQNGKTEKVPYVVTDTRMQIRLPRAVTAHGGKINILIKYHYTIPGAFGGRTDYTDTKNGKIYEIAQWFPRMCVYDDSQGWDTLPFLGSGEFYCEYGDIDYSCGIGRVG